ncbi:MAG: lactate utilization protein LutB domain-containing protein [Planctomycetota bacterium]|jgi:L-lactate dehydrogenase complex protein LldF
MIDQRITRWQTRLPLRLWARCLRSERLYRLAAATFRIFVRLLARSRPSGEPFASRRWVRRLPGPLRGWTDQRDFLPPAPESFRDWWKRHQRETTP